MLKGETLGALLLERCGYAPPDSSPRQAVRSGPLGLPASPTSAKWLGARCPARRRTTDHPQMMLGPRAVDLAPPLTTLTFQLLNSVLCAQDEAGHFA